MQRAFFCCFRQGMAGTSRDLGLDVPGSEELQAIKFLLISIPNVTGRPGCWTTEMNEGSSAPYLARAPCVPLFCTETEGLVDYQERAGIMSIVQWTLLPVIFGVDDTFIPYNKQEALPEEMVLEYVFLKDVSGKKHQHKHNFFGPDFPQTFPTLMPGCPGVKKFLPDVHDFWRGCP